MSQPFRLAPAILKSLLFATSLLGVTPAFIPTNTVRAQATTASPAPPGAPLRISGTLRSAESREVVRHARVVADRTSTVPPVVSSVNSNLAPVRDFCEAI